MNLGGFYEYWEIQNACRISDDSFVGRNHTLWLVWSVVCGIISKRFIDAVAYDARCGAKGHSQ